MISISYHTKPACRTYPLHISAFTFVRHCLDSIIVFSNLLVFRSNPLNALQKCSFHSAWYSVTDVQIELLPRMINVTEGQDFTFEVVKQSGFSFGAIPFWILPLTYAQFEARNFSLDELFPMRPPSAASEGLLPAIMCVMFWKWICYIVSTLWRDMENFQ